MFLLIFFLHELAVLAAAQTSHNVSVGVTGSFFDPPTVSAGEGDIVNFIFGGDLHDITQSNFSDPCAPLPGGFSSGFLGRGPNFAGPPMMFSLKITNASEPIWYFCASTVPFSHCNSGMVGSINPPSQDEFSSFRDAAQQDTTTAHFSPTLSLNGFFASATPPITLNPSDLTISFSMFGSNSSTGTTPSMTSSPTPLPTSTPTSASHSNNHGAVIGGAVAAAVGAFLLLCLCTILYRRFRRERPASVGSRFFDYDHRPTAALFSNNTSPPHTAHSPNFSTSHHDPSTITAFTDNQNLHPYSARAMMSEYTSSSKSASPPFQPVRFVDPKNTGPPVGHYNYTPGPGHIRSDQPSINRDHSYAAVTPASGTQPTPNLSSSEAGSEQGQGADIQAIAKQVVALLKESGARQEDTGGSKPPTARSDAEPAPPKYRTTNHTSES